MTFIEVIKNFSKQLEYDPVVENADRLRSFKRLVFVGMGGSALGPDLLKVLRPELDILIHRDYGLPSLPESALAESLIVLNSYSGNTAEVLEAFNLATEKSLNTAVISTGGKLMESAKNSGVPYVQMPDLQTQPRWALGLNLRAIFKLTGEEDLLRKSSSISLDPLQYENAGREIAEELKNLIPVIYSSRQNGPLSYVWKINYNETAKIPAFSNVFPELNHNEMAGFESRDLSSDFYHVLLKDSSDHPELLKRIDATSKVMMDKDLKVRVVDLEGGDKLAKVFNSIILAYWSSYYLAKNSGVDPEEIRIIEDFKKMV